MSLIIFRIEMRATYYVSLSFGQKMTNPLSNAWTCVLNSMMSAHLLVFEVRYDETRGARAPFWLVGGWVAPLNGCRWTYTAYIPITVNFNAKMRNMIIKYNK